jgi:sugar lactone lactonase YvrE
MDVSESTSLPTIEDERLQPVWQADRVWNGMTTLPDGRAFASFPSCDGPGVQVAEILADGKLRPYPDQAWNVVNDPPSPNGAFVRVNAIRVGPDGNIWVIDAGAPGIGAEAVARGARLIAIDPLTDRIAEILDLSAAVKPHTYIDDIRFNGDRVYITDAGEPGLVVFDRATGTARRVLDEHASTIDQRDMYADGTLLVTEKGKPLRVHADQLEVSPDGKFLYYQSSSGPLSRIATALLDDPSTDATTLASAVEAFFDSPTTGGTVIDAEGNIYLSDTDKRRILRISPSGESSVLIEDPRLIWSDAMWIDAEGWLWIPATQQNRTPGFAGGAMQVEYPVWIYRMQIGIGPSPNDHA